MKSVSKGCTSLKALYNCDTSNPTLASAREQNCQENIFDGQSVTAYVLVEYNMNYLIESSVVDTKILDKNCDIPIQTPVATEKVPISMEEHL